ncbi:MAG: DMT family transporter [Alphaproteobacteria bacterium]
MDTHKIAFTVMLMLAASALIAGTSLLAKMLGTEVLGPALNPFQITAGRYAFALIALVIVTTIVRPNFTRPALRLHVGRAVAGSLGVTSMFAAATLIPLADATAITMLNPIIAMVLAIPLLGEKVGPRRWAAAALSIVGAVLLIRPGAASFQPAALIALLAAFVLAFEIIIIKLLSRREGTIQILLFSNGFGTILSGIAAVFIWIWPTPMQWLGLGAIGLLMISAQSLFLLAIRRGDASFVAPLFYATLVFAALYDFTTFGVIPSTLSYAGGGIIILGALLMAWSERRRMQ